MQHDYAVDAHAVCVRGAEIGCENPQGVEIGAFSVIEPWRVDEVYAPAVPFEVEDVNRASA